MIMINGLYSMVSNYFEGTTCISSVEFDALDDGEKQTRCLNNYLSKLSVGNKSNDESLFLI